MAANIGPRIGVDGEAEYRKQINNIIQQSKTLGSQMSALTSGFSANDSSMKKARQSAELYAKQVDNQKDRVNALTKMLNASAKEFGENDTKTLKWKQAVNEATAELNKLESELKQAKQESSLFHSALEKSSAGLKSLGGVLGKGLATAAKASVAAITAAGTAVVGLGKIGLDYNSQMEKYTTNFEVMLGSQEAAMEKVESLKTMAAKTPFEMSGLADATQQLLAMGVANEDTNKYLQQLGDISLGDAEKLGTLVNAFGKMNSTGKVSLEYINMMAEQGFNPLNLIAEKTGETMTELYDRVSKGEVSFDEIKEAMETATSAGGQFYQGMEQASKTTEGMISTLKDNATALIGEVFSPISEGLKTELLPTAIDAIDRLSTAFQEDGVESMISAAGDIIGETLGTFSDALPKFVDSAVSIVKSLLSGISKNLDSITDGAISTVEALIEGFMDMLPDIIVTGALLLGKLAVGIVEAIPDLIRKIPEIIKAIKDGFAAKGGEWKNIGQDIIKGLWEGLKSLGSWLGDKVSGLLGGTVKSAKKELDIHSPSGVFEEMGEYSALGYGKGWENKIKGIRAQVGAGLDFGSMVSDQKTIMPAATTNNAINYGGISIVVHGAQGQDVNQLADVIMQRIDRAVRQKEAVFGAA